MTCPALTNKAGRLFVSVSPQARDMPTDEFYWLNYAQVPGLGNVGDTGLDQTIDHFEVFNAEVELPFKGSARVQSFDIDFLDADSQARDILDFAAQPGNYNPHAVKMQWDNGDLEFILVLVSSPMYVKGGGSDVRIRRYTLTPVVAPIRVVQPVMPPTSNLIITQSPYMVAS